MTEIQAVIAKVQLTKLEYIVNQNMNINRLNYISLENSQLELIMNSLNITYKVIDSNTYQNGIHTVYIFCPFRFRLKYNPISV